MSAKRGAGSLIGSLLAGVLLCAGCATTRCLAPEATLPPAPAWPPDHAYTLDEIVALSVYRNASIDVVRYEAEAAQGLVDQVKALWLPTFRYDFAATAYNNDLAYHLRAFNLVTVNVPLTGAYNIVNSANLAQIISTGGKRTSALQQTKMLAELLRIDVLRQQDLVACEVATFYQLICLASDVDAVLADALRRIRVFRQVADGLHARGSLRTSDLDTLQAELLVTELEQLQIALRSGRDQAYSALKKAVGVDPAEPLLLAAPTLPPLVNPAERLSVAAAVVKGFLQRPENQEVNLFARIAAEQVHFAKTCWAPNVAVATSATVIDGHPTNILNAIDGIIAGVIIDVPLYDPGRRARLRQALALEQAGLAVQREVEQLLTLQIQVTALQAQTTLTTLALAARARQAADEHEAAAREAFSRELIPASGMITAIALNAVGKSAYLQSLFCYHNARARLKNVTSDRETPYGY
jgi:outer membrane protein TolC